MMILELLSWWYGAGWQRVARSIVKATTTIEHNFSVMTLLGTLFSPWRRIVSYGSRSLDEKMRAALDNFISRLVGFFVRFFVVIAALISMLVVFVVMSAVTLIWPLVPLLIIYSAVRGIIG